MKDSSTNGGDMPQTAANGSDNAVNGDAGVALAQGGDEHAGKVATAVEAVKRMFGVDYPEWKDATEDGKRARDCFLSTVSVKALLDIEWKAHGLPPVWAEAVLKAGFIKPASGRIQTREPGAALAGGKEQKGYYAPPLRTTERDAEIQRGVDAVARDVARGVGWMTTPELGTMKRPGYLRDANKALVAQRPQVERVGFVENLPSTFTGGGIRFVTGFMIPKDGTFLDGTPKRKKVPHGDGMVGDSVYLRGVDALGEPGEFTVTVRGKTGQDVTQKAAFVGLHMYHTRGTRAVCLDVDGILAAADVVRDGAQLVAVVCSKLGDADFRVQIIRAAVKAGHWIERSVSGCGIHVWLLGVSRIGTKSGSHPVEVYDHSYAEKRDSAWGFIALGKRILVARGTADDCGDGVEPADSLLDGQDIIDAVVGHYWPKEAERDARVSGVVVDGEVIDGSGAGGVLSQGGDKDEESLTLPPDDSYHDTLSKARAADGEWGNVDASTAKGMKAQLQANIVAASGELGSQVQRFIDMGLAGNETVDAMRRVDWVNAQAETARAAIRGVNKGAGSDQHWHTVKTWALLQGVGQEPWLLGDYLNKFPNKADGKPLGWAKEDGSPDRSQLLWSLYLDLLRLLQPDDDDKRRYAVKVIAHVVEGSGAWEWALNKRGGDAGAARKLVWDEVMKASSKYMERVKEAKEAEKAKAARDTRSQGGDDLLAELKARAREPWSTAKHRRDVEDFSYPLKWSDVAWFHWSKAKNPAPLCTAENVGLLLMCYGLRVRFNDMRHAPEYEGFAVDDGDHEAALNRVYALATMNGLSWKIDDVDRMFTQWAQNNRFHPAREWIEGKSWDGISRIEAFADTVTVQEGQRDNWLMYFRRWALGAIHALYSYTGGASKHMLVLQGKQSDGKTSWFRTLTGGQPIGKDGVMLDVKNKDSVAETLTWWLVELGELEATYTTKHLAELKAFTSKLTDEWRSPYGRKVNVYPRRTAFVGTVNKDEPLADRTGNTRFATVTTERINYQHSIDAQQMWAEVLHIFGTGTAEEKRHWLTKEEEAAMEVQNEQYTAKSGVYDELEYLFDWSEAARDDMRRKYAEKNKAPFAYHYTIYAAMGLTDGSTPSHPRKLEISDALEKLGAIKVKERKAPGEQNARGFYLPVCNTDNPMRGMKKGQYLKILPST